MSRSDSVVGWPDGPPPPPPDGPKIKIERFTKGGRKVFVMLGNVAVRHSHWSESLRKSVPCHELRAKVPENQPTTCPLCNDRAWLGTRRSEGFVPAMVQNVTKGQWEQAVVVLTGSGLKQLDAIDAKQEEPRPYRGRKFVGRKLQQGSTTPMELQELPIETLAEFPGGLPDTFSVAAVMLTVWCPDRTPNEPIRYIDPIPFPKQRTRPEPTEREVMHFTPEQLAAMQRYFPRTAAMSSAEAAPSRLPPGDPPAASPTPDLTQTPAPRVHVNGHPKRQETPPDDPGEPRPTIPMTAARSAAPKPKPQMVPDPEQALRVAEARRRKQAGVPPTADEAVEFGRVLDYILPNRIAKSGKGGASS